MCSSDAGLQRVERGGSALWPGQQPVSASIALHPLAVAGERASPCFSSVAVYAESHAFLKGWLPPSVYTLNPQPSTPNPRP